MKVTSKRKPVEPTAQLQDGQDTPSKKVRSETPKAPNSRPTQAIDKTSEKQRSLFERWCSSVKSSAAETPRLAPQPEIDKAEASAGECTAVTVATAQRPEVKDDVSKGAPITIEDSDAGGDSNQQRKEDKSISSNQKTVQQEQPLSAAASVLSVKSDSTIDITQDDVVIDKDVNANRKVITVNKKVRRPRKKRLSVEKPGAKSIPAADAAATATAAADVDMLNKSTEVTAAAADANTSATAIAQPDAKSAKASRKPRKKVVAAPVQDEAALRELCATIASVVSACAADSNSAIIPPVAPAEVAAAPMDVDKQQIDGDSNSVVQLNETSATATPTVSKNGTEKDKDKPSVGRPRKSPQANPEPDPKTVAKTAAVQQMSSFMKRFFVQSDTVSEKPPTRTGELVEEDVNRTLVQADAASVTNDLRFKPFQLKRSMRLAPVWRVDPASVNRALLETLIDSESGNKPDVARDQLYLAELKSGVFVPRCCGPTWPLAEAGCVQLPERKAGPEAEAGAEAESDVEMLETDTCSNEPEVSVMSVGEPACVAPAQAAAESAAPGRCHPKCKLLQFHDNYRPAYFGSFRKRSAVILPRRPLAKDTVALNYEVESDEEWGCEPEGESVSSSSERAADEPGERSDDYELDEFFVPHGYLSADEQHVSGDEAPAADDNEGPDVTPAMRKAVQQITAKQLAARQRRAATRSLCPLLVGCVYFSDREDEAVSKLTGVPDKLRRVFTPLPKPQQPIFGFGSCVTRILFEPAAYELERLERASSKQQRSAATADGESALQTPSLRHEPTEDGEPTPQGRFSGLAFDRAVHCGRLVPFPDAALPYLVKMLHGSERSLAKMVNEFRLFWFYRSFKLETDRRGGSVGEDKLQPKSDESIDNENAGEVQGALLSKRQIELKANIIATYAAKSAEARKRCWAVSEQVRQAHPGYEQLELFVPPDFAAVFAERIGAQVTTPRSQPQPQLQPQPQPQSPSVQPDAASGVTPLPKAAKPKAKRTTPSSAAGTTTLKTSVKPGSKNASPIVNASPVGALPKCVQSRLSKGTPSPTLIVSESKSKSGTAPAVMTVSTADANAVRKTITPVRVMLENLSRETEKPADNPVSQLPSSTPTPMPTPNSTPKLTPGAPSSASVKANAVVASPSLQQTPKARRVQLTTVSTSVTNAALQPKVTRTEGEDTNVQQTR